MKKELPVAAIVDRLGRAALNLKNAGDVSASEHIMFALTLIYRLADADEESIEQPDESD